MGESDRLANRLKQNQQTDKSDHIYLRSISRFTIAAKPADIARFVLNAGTGNLRFPHGDTTRLLREKRRLMLRFSLVFRCILIFHDKVTESRPSRLSQRYFHLEIP
jgi:hypothetical protein